MTKATTQKFVDDFTEAENLCNNNKLQESLEKYNALLEQNPNHVSVLNNMGLVNEKLGNFSKAIDFYKKCYTLMPDRVILIHNLANAYIRLEKWADAMPLLKKIVEVDFEREKNAERYALCLFNASTKKETQEFIQRVVTMYPKNALLNRLLGKTLLHLNLHIDGLRYLQKGAGVIEFNADGMKVLN